jgi:hypothetical protein
VNVDRARQLLLLICTTMLAAAIVVGQSGPAAAAKGSSPTVSLASYDGWCDDEEDIEDPDCYEDTGEDEDWNPDENPDVADPEAEPPPPPPPPIQWPAPPKGAYARIKQGSRKAIAPKRAPPPVKAMIRAANRLVRKPYKWGGGHGRWNDRGYDCSGAVSYILHAGGQLDWPLTSGGLAKWGKRGAGNWVRVYANKNHVFIVIAGLRFDTTPWGARFGKGPRWRDTVRPTGGFKLRHPAGL